MNKKLLTPLAAIFAIALVVAGGYYAITSYTISINQPIEVLGPTEQLIDCDAGDTCRGDGITVTNDGDSEREIVVTDNAGSYPDAIDDIRYVGELTLTEKNVNFSDDSAPWTIPSGAEEVTVEYTVIGDSFSAKVISEPTLSEDYVLVYYSDNIDRFTEPNVAIKVEDVSGNLPPYDGDENANEYDYCEMGEYDTCHGAKIWYVPENALTAKGENTWAINWNRASEFFYETKLIQYNSNGEITVYPESVTNGVSADLTIYPEVDINKYASEGDRTLEITIA